MPKLKQATSVTKVANDSDESSQELGNTEQYLVHLGGKALSLDLMNLIRKQVELRMKALDQGRPYTLRQICGEEFWSQLKKGEPITAGGCMVYMTKQSILPLTLVGKRSSNDKLYQLK